MTNPSSADERALPPLPEVGYLGDDVSYGYDSCDMRDYALEAIAADRLRASLGAAQVPSLPPHLHISEMLRIYDEKGGDWLRIAREVEQRTFATLSQPSQQEPV